MVVYCSSFAKFVKNNTIVVVCFLWNELLKIDFLAFKSFIPNALKLSISILFSLEMFKSSECYRF